MVAEDAWFALVQGKQFGPLSATAVGDLLRADGLRRGDLLWCSRLRAWHPVESLGEFASLIDEPAAPLAPRSRHAWVIAIALALWTAAAGTWAADAVVEFIDLGNLAREASLTVFSAAALIVTAALLIPSAWSALRPERLRYLVLGRIAWTAVLGTAGVFATTTLALAVNSSSLIELAFGRDDLEGGQVLFTRPGVLEITGPLSAGLGARLRASLERDRSAHTVVLNSEGGWVREGEIIAGLISDAKLSTHSSTGCESACTVAFLAGRRRTLSDDALLGFHSVASDGADALLLKEATRAYAGALMGGTVSKAFRARVADTPPDDMWYPTLEELKAEGMVHAVADLPANE